MRHTKLDRQIHRAAGLILNVVTIALLLTAVGSFGLAYMDDNGVDTSGLADRAVVTMMGGRPQEGESGRLSARAILNHRVRQPVLVASGDFLRKGERLIAIMGMAGDFSLLDEQGKLVRRGVMSELESWFEDIDSEVNVCTLRDEVGRDLLVFRSKYGFSEETWFLDFARETARSHQPLLGTMGGAVDDEVRSMRNDQGSDLLIQFIYGTSPECIALTTQGQVAWRIPAQITYVFGVMEAGDFLPDPGDELVLVEGNARLRVVNGRGEVIRRYLLPPECETAEWTMRRRPEDGAVCLAVNAAQNGGAIVLETGEYRTFDWLLHTANSLSHDLGPAVAVDPSVAYDREEFITVRGEWAMLVDSKGKIHDAVEVPGLWLLRQGNGSALCILSDVGGKRVPYYVKVRAGD